MQTNKNIRCQQTPTKLQILPILSSLLTPITHQQSANNKMTDIQLCSLLQNNHQQIPTNTINTGNTFSPKQTPTISKKKTKTFNKHQHWSTNTNLVHCKTFANAHQPTPTTTKIFILQQMLEFTMEKNKLSKMETP